MSDGTLLICYRDNVANPNWRIFLPENSRMSSAGLILGHCSTTKLYDIIRARFAGKNLRTLCIAYQCPDRCERYKLLGQGYGKLPSRHVSIAPWNEVCIDLINPWKVQVQGKEIEFNALTCIDPATNLVELIRIENKPSAYIRQQFENCWLSRYPKPTMVDSSLAGNSKSSYHNMVSKMSQLW